MILFKKSESANILHRILKLTLVEKQESFVRFYM